MEIKRRTAILTLCFLAAVPLAARAGQTAGEKSKDALAEAARQGYPLKTEMMVQGNVTVQSVLIPEPVARRVFGKEISRQYAVIALTVSNKSSNAVLIVQGAFIDYRDWALSGSLSTGAGGGDASQLDHQFQKSAQANQVASEEYRIVRGQLLDAQPWTARNTIVRLLTLTGSLASGYSFSLKEKGLIKGISAFNGTVVPGVGTFWPDGTVEQLNRISDFGYKTNKVISKQGSDIIVCFFPIDRFLTPGFKKVYLKSPALFFSPFEMLVDTTVQPQIEKLLGREFFGVDLQEMRNNLPCFMQWEKLNQQSPGTLSSDPIIQTCKAGNRLRPEVILALETLKRVSLNTVRVVVDGVMSVETGAIPAKIESIAFDGGNDNPALWAEKGEKRGTIKGAFLAGGLPRIEEATLLGITDLTSMAAGSTDQTLYFSLKLTRPIPAGRILTFVVEKRDKDGRGEMNNAVESMRYGFVAGHQDPGIQAVIEGKR